MGSQLLIGTLLRIARQDLDGARLLSAAANRNAIYLCEQAAEKVILAVLTSEGKHGGIRHKLHEMVDLVPDENPIKPMLRAIEDLGRFATAYRYPTTKGKMAPVPSTAEFDKHAASVERALSAAVAAFKVDLSKPNAPAGTTGQIR